ncbi:MAG: alpha/beta hydrolase fold domain-containing protein [Opitutaceae bacterium]
MKTVCILSFLLLNAYASSAVGSTAYLNSDRDGIIRLEEFSNVNLDAFEHADANVDQMLDSAELKRYLNYQRLLEANRLELLKQAKVFTDLAYVEDGHARQRLDLYLPRNVAEGDTIPLVIWIHGGGWRKGSKGVISEQVFLLEQGFALASVNYRLSRHAEFPAQIYDCKAAVRYLRKHANTYGIDPDRIGVWGSSAGGHLAALLGTTGDVVALEGSLGVTDVSSRVQAVCDWFGVTDMLPLGDPGYQPEIAEKDPAEQPLAKLLGGLISNKRELARSASPIHYVTEDDPPFLIMHGDQDALVPLQQSIGFHERLMEQGASSELIIVEGAKHTFFKEQTERDRVISFFDQHLNVTPASGIHAPFNRHYALEEAGEVLSWINTEKGLGAVAYHRGLLLAPMSFDFGGGLGDGAFVAYNVDDPRKPYTVFDSRDFPERFHDETSPHYLGNLSENHGMYFHEDRVMLGERGFDSAGFLILDCAPLYDDDPETLPEVVCRYFFPEVELTTVYDGFTFAPAWAGGRYVYAPTGSNGLYIVDTSDLSDPKLLAHLRKDQLYNQTLRSAHAVGDLLILSPAAIASNSADIVLLDVSNPAFPSLVNRHTVKVGYQGFVYGSRFYNGAFSGNRGNDKTSEIIAYDFSNPLNIQTIELGHTERLFKPEYLYVQDDDLFIGHYPGLSRWHVEHDALSFQLAIEPQHPPANDYAFVSPLGNLTVVTSDHLVDSYINIGVNQSAPDRKAPEVKFVLPEVGQKNVSLTAKVGISFSESISNESLIDGSVIIVERGASAPLACDLGHGMGIVHAVPSEALKKNTTYDVYVTSQLADLVGNSFGAKQLVTSFSTGSDLADYSNRISTSAPSPVGQGVRLTGAVNDPTLAKTIEYSWNFGDGSEPTPFSREASITKTFSKPGNYNITLTTRRDGSEKMVKSSAVQVIHTQLPETRPFSSSSLCLNEETGVLYLVNPDNDSLTAIDTNTGLPRYEVATGQKPVSIARSGDELWVSCLSEDAIVIHSMQDGIRLRQIDLGYGRAPHGLVMNTRGQVCYVANSRLGQVQEISTATYALTRNLQLAGALRELSYVPERALLVAPQFIATNQQGSIVQWIDVDDWKVTYSESLQATLENDGLNNGRGYPNYLGPVATNPEQTRIWIPGKKDNLFRGIRRDGEPLTFDHTVRSVAVSVDLIDATEVYADRIDLDNSDFASAVAFNPFGNILYIATMGSQTIWAVDAYNPDNQSVFNTYGEGPNALLTNASGSQLYVHNQLSRVISVFDAKPDGELKFNTKWRTVSEESLASDVLEGKRLFHNTTRGSMAQEGYMSCASCHRDGGHDGRVWDISSLGEGFRNTIDLRGRGGMNHGMLHWTGNFDEVQDFNNQITALNEGTGFVFDKITKAHPQLAESKFGVHRELDTLAAYVSSLTEYPKSPYKEPNGEMTDAALKGRQHFISMDCYTCHSGPTFTDSKLRKLHDVGTRKETSGSRLNGDFIGLDTPTLISTWQSAPYLHDGSAPTLEAVFTTGSGKTADAHQRAAKLSPDEFEELIAYLKQLDREGGITAHDLGSPNQSPVFGEAQYTFNYIYRYDQSAHPIGGVQAHDADSEGALKYQLAPSGAAGLFSIDPQSGAIRFLYQDHYFRHRFNLPYESKKTYWFNVLAVDSSAYPGIDEAKVVVHVTYPKLDLSIDELNEWKRSSRLLDKGKVLSAEQQKRMESIQRIISSGF